MKWISIKTTIYASVVVPDPYVFGPPGSFYHQEKLVRKPVISSVLSIFDFMTFLSLQTDENVPLKSKKEKNCKLKTYFL
jgi:hypothetical protein